MSCQDFETRLPDYITGRLDPREESALARHLEACGACSRYAEDLRDLYALDIDEDYGDGLPTFAVPTTRRPGRLLLRAGAIFLAAAAAVFLLVLGPFGLGTPRYVPGPGAALQPIEVASPTLPASYAPRDWHTDLSEARELASYTGQPILATWSWVVCPRCRMVEQAMRSEQGRALVRGFVPVQVRFMELPEELKPYRGRQPWQISMPAAFIEQGEQRSPTTFGVSGLTSIRRQIQSWQEGERTVPLTEEQFDECRDTLTATPGLLAEKRLGPALEGLERVQRLAAEHGSRFAEHASEMRADIVQQLDSAIAKIRVDFEAGGQARADARERARRLHEALAGHAIGDALAAFLER